ncbi:PrgI family protein [Aneurinibacillus thermoaerophilus]|jgi:hypothetical protein|uniref:PrgI family protein n=1 Tax=Aneurinibacillus thermoaerophilus TaxID=143495 RepID=UPI002E1C4009|nr:PrgI family protein [Aneurinibacillus thermoaerophilus]MED0738867.1 PrgI family protein [Aneurinibacillus thermoaerophilus]
MCGDQHLLSYNSNEESKVIYGLSFRQLGWILGGGFASMKLFSWLPPLPFLGIIGYLPHAIPLFLSVAFAYIKHPKTGLSLAKYLYSWMKCKRKRRIFI